MTYDAREVANFILDRCDALGREVSNLSLQKIVYFCHVWTLIALQRPLIREEFEAWELGPVMPYLYREFKVFGDSRITRRASKLDRSNGQRVLAQYKFDDEIQTLLTEVVSSYSGLSPYQLVQISHVKGGPWNQVWNHGERINAGMRISNALISEFYSAQSRPNSIQ
jgi:uncharacterized phage-associated protein